VGDRVMRFEAIPRSQKVAHAIVQRIVAAMKAGTLKRGDRLPSEQELCFELGASRIAVREALKVLEALGAVEIRQGSGTYIPKEPRPPVIDPLQFLLSLGDAQPGHVKELRFMVELGFSRIAQRKMTAEELQALEAESPHHPARQGDSGPVPRVHRSRDPGAPRGPGQAPPAHPQGHQGPGSQQAGGGIT